ncbi:MAG: hypothetical protein IT381_19005 [Deltaproteobacteria bacterium]|nr:hypothetical protein [Deltaproteobacteria bacterium]
MRAIVSTVLACLAGCARTVPYEPRPVAKNLSRPAPKEGNTLGTAHPVYSATVAPDGAWAVVCQARRDTDRDGTIAAIYSGCGNAKVTGDERHLWLVVEEGDGEIIDLFFGSDPSGRWIAYTAADTLFLRDTVGGERVALLRKVASVGRAHRDGLAAFSDDGRWLLHPDREGDRIVLKLRDLELRHETLVPTPEGSWWLPRFVPTSDAIAFHMLPPGMERPFEPIAMDEDVCTEPMTIERATHGWWPDTIVQPLDFSRPAIHVSAGWPTLRGGLAVSDGKGASFLGYDGTREVLTDQCVSTILHVDVFTGAMVAHACDGGHVWLRRGYPAKPLPRSLRLSKPMGHRRLLPESRDKVLYAWDISTGESIAVAKLVRGLGKEPWEEQGTSDDGFSVWGLETRVNVERGRDGAWRARAVSETIESRQEYRNRADPASYLVRAQRGAFELRMAGRDLGPLRWQLRVTPRE